MEEKMSAEEQIEALEQEAQRWRSHAAFWMMAFDAMTNYNQEAGFEADTGNPALFEEHFRWFVIHALKQGYFQPEFTGPQGKTYMIESDHGPVDAIPVAILMEVAGLFTYDVRSWIDEFRRRSLDDAEYAQEILGSASDYFQFAPDNDGSFVQGFKMSDLPQELQDHIFESQFGNHYVVHVMHGERACRHPYEQLQQAIEAAAHDERAGVITQALSITYRGAVVMDSDELRERIERINNAGMN